MLHTLKIEGFCKECGAEVYTDDVIEGYKDVYECPKCGHPHGKNELWDEVPYYIKSK